MADLTIPPGDREQIAIRLAEADFVEWDRYIAFKHHDELAVEVYGWIPRPDDHEDFVWTRFYPERETLEYTTSSDKYSKELTRIWFGEDAVDDHNECRRVEDAFDVPNAIEL